MAEAENNWSWIEECRWRRRISASAVGSALFFFGAIFELLAAPSLTAQLDRQVVPVGENVTLSLIFEGASPGGTPNLPALPNLRQIGVGRSSQSLNNQVVSQTYTYMMVATQPGDIIIPALQIRVGGQILASQPLQLKIVRGAEAAKSNAATTNFALLELRVPKNEVYLGEPFLVEVQLDVQNAENISRPQLKTEGFSLSGQNAPHNQSQVRRGNVVYNRLNFMMSATAARTGTLTLGPAECNLTLLIPVNNARRDPFFDLFGGGVQRRPVTLASDSQPIRVLPLPKDNVPASFNGAVGRFSLSASIGPTNLAVGDPVTVRVQVAGEGAIEALTLPPQPEWREFKVYPPSSSVELKDPLGLSGSKTFEQVIIPQNHEIKALPSFEFSYFDPGQKIYRTLSHPATPLTVRPSAAVPVPPPSLTNDVTADNAQPPPADDIEHIRVRLDSAGLLRQPLIQQGWFLPLQGVPLLVWLWLVMLRKRAVWLANNPKVRRQRQVAQRVREGVRELQTLASSQQSEDFFAAVFRLMQEQLGERLDLPASAITEAVIDGRLRGHNVSEQTLNVLHELFQACNQARYAPQKSSQELADLVPRVERVLRELQQWKG